MLPENVRIIVAVDPTGIIGLGGQIPWKKSADLKRFKAVTMGGTLVMGRKTFDSIGRRKLPGRETIVVSRHKQEGVESFTSVPEAIDHAVTLGNPVWIAGGANIYELAFPLIQEIDLTLVTDFSLDSPAVAESVEDFNVVRFRLFAEGMPGFVLEKEELNGEDATLLHRTYKRWPISP
jgi:dihydrofolate reductase